MMQKTLRGRCTAANAPALATESEEHVDIAGANGGDPTHHVQLSDR